MQAKYKIIYRGLNTKHFYWEFVNILRKIFLVSVNVFLQSEIELFKAMITLLILAIIMRVQQYLKPYKDELINILEYREITTSVVTFFGSLLFVSEDVSEPVRICTLTVILICNAWFFSLWSYCAMMQFNYKFLHRLAILFKYISLLDK